jgi:hypothetical protein
MPRGLLWQEIQTGYSIVKPHVHFHPPYLLLIPLLNFRIFSGYFTSRIPDRDLDKVFPLIPLCFQIIDPIYSDLKCVLE